MDYFISDLHNLDKYIITYTHRPFDNIYVMRQIFINNWNNIINDNDTVYLLGDIGDAEILKELKGKIVIIIGNHDSYDELKTIYPDLEIYKHPIMVGGLWLSHEPITYIPKECPYLNIHGHLHDLDYGLIGRKWEDGNRYFNVSVEKIGYTPISLEKIYDLIGY